MFMRRKDTVLIVDDNKLNRKALMDILSGEYDILQAGDGAEALEVLEQHRDSVVAIILDLVMPRMNGYEFLREYQKEEKYKNIPVVVATVEEDKNNEKRCLELGVWDFIPKSFEQDIIRFRIMNVIKQSKVHSLEHDPLTGLFNQQKFYMEIKELLKQEADTKYAFIRVDIDRFKMINSFYGTKEGDNLICYLAEVISGQLDDVEDGVYGRIMADVFGICIPYSEDKVKRIAKTVRESLKYYKANYYLEVSIGIYVIEDNRMEASSIYDRATIAVKQCKGHYRTPYVIYTEEMGAQIVREQQIVNEMDRALEEEQFVVYLQPQYDANTRQSYGAEALVRWKKPDGHIVSPGEFIPVFEKNGFIVNLDFYVWEKVCQFIRRRLDEGKRVEAISVNVSRVNLYNPKFMEKLIDLVDKYRIPIKYLQLEITESAFFDNIQILKDVINYLHKAGFTILMDDFGSGYSSLNVLKDINVDVLKIDMGFLPRGSSDIRGKKILEAVINMAKALGMPSIAEGVETEEQFKLLQKLGCSVIQGFYFARPMPITEYEALLDKE